MEKLEWDEAQLRPNTDPRRDLLLKRVQDALMLARLAEAREKILEAAGGAITTAEAAERLSTTSDAVRKRIQRGTLLSFTTPSGEHRLPLAQFHRNDVVEGLQDVLGAMHVTDPWVRLQLFLAEDVLGEMKAGRVENAVRAVGSYLPLDEDE